MLAWYRRRIEGERDREWCSALSILGVEWKTPAVALYRGAEYVQERTGHLMQLGLQLGLRIGEARERARIQDEKGSIGSQREDKA